MKTKSGPKTIGLCGYCGRTEPLTRDHIPPQCLFEKPYPSDLITVPCCEGCRAGWSDDDEYFRAAVVANLNVHGEPKAQQAWDGLLRSMGKPTKKGFAKRILQDIHDVEVESESGIYLGTAAAFSLDKTRIDRVLQRIIRGLFFHAFQCPLPSSHEALCHLQQFGFGYLSQELNGITFPPPRSTGNGIFEFTYRQTHEDKHSSVWIGSFYGRLPFIGFTRPKSTPEKKRAASNECVHLIAEKAGSG